MIYKAEDKWNTDAPQLEHAMAPGSSRGRHKYIMKIGNGPNARYFYTAAEVAAYRNSIRGGARGSDTNNLRNTTATTNRNASRSTNMLNRTQVRKEQQTANAANQREMAGRRREARKQAYVDFQRNRGKEAPRQDTSRPSTDNAKIKRTEAHNNRVATAQAKRKAAYEKAHPIETNFKKAKKAATSAYKSASKTANSAYKSAKKAYNSKQGKAIRKKAKKTAQTAYKRGSSFVKKLFNR